MGAIVAALPFENEDSRNPKNIRQQNPQLAQRLQDFASGKLFKKYIALGAAVLSALILVLALTSVVGDIDIQSASEPRKVALPSGERVNGEISEVLEAAVKANCQGIPDGLFVLKNDQKGADHYSVVGSDSYGVFKMVPLRGGWMISSVFTPWDCKSTIVIE